MSSEAWFRPFVWLDYRLAVVFTVLVPLILLLWTVVTKADAIQRLLIIYWRVASLLVITVYLAIASLPISFVSGIVARILIPIGLWFWVDINEEIDDRPPSPLKWAVTAWRWAISIYCGLGVLFQLPTLQCATLPTSELVEKASCTAWLEASWRYKEYVHANTSPAFLGFLGIVGLTIYVLYLAYFVFVRLGRKGRSAMGS
ncbi:MAG TPA: DUF3177 family protein [Oscillatoriales cyanobacterium M59_W2019_021]|nr:DUF3177 family protein [Oscillatoriales cyanobacterium M4454_W2019_049]HIK53109.1 DUF3177 family protein [Oscillatoriales cyanobacterium M59_W2019_021]